MVGAVILNLCWEALLFNLSCYRSSLVFLLRALRTHRHLLERARQGLRLDEIINQVLSGLDGILSAASICDERVEL